MFRRDRHLGADCFRSSAPCIDGSPDTTQTSGQETGCHTCARGRAPGGASRQIRGPADALPKLFES
jgi:hypothetical protein